MFSAVRRLFGSIDVREEGDLIVISGLPGDRIAREIYRYWATSRIEKFMFVRYTSSRISFYKFYAIEFLYMLNTLAEDRKSNVGRKVYLNLIDLLKENTWIKDIELTHPPVLDRSKINVFHKTPLPHQVKFFDIYDEMVPRYHFNGYVLALDTGAGKTLTSLMTAEALRSDHIVTLCPTRALYNVWRKAYETEYKKPVDNWVSRDNLPFPKDPPKGIIVHYEFLDKVMQDIINLGKRNKRITLIIDESHSFNEITAQRTQLLIELCRKVSFVTVLWLSATPIKALGSEMIPMLLTFDPFMDEKVAESFKKIFGKNTTKGLDIIKNRMGLISYVVKIEKSNPIIVNLPVEIPDPKPFLLETIQKDMRAYIVERLDYYKKNMKTFIEIYENGVREFEYEYGDDYREELSIYKSYIKTIRKGYDAATMVELAKYCNDFELKTIYPRLDPAIRGEWRDVRSIVKYVDLKVRGECLGNIVGKRRSAVVVDMVPHIGLEDLINKSIKKVVVFTSYVAGVEATLEYLKKKGIRAIGIWGEHTKDVSSLVNEFGRNDKIKVLVTTYQSLSSAMPLTMANTIITLNVPFRDHDYQQAIGRIDRIDQDTQTEVYNAVLDTGPKPNISSRTFDILSWSKDMVEQIMGKGSDVPDEAPALESYMGYNITLEELNIERGVTDTMNYNCVFEDTEDDDLLINKLIKRNHEGEASPVSQTAALLAQREKMEEEVQEAAKEAKELADKQDDYDSGDDTDDSDDEADDSEDSGDGDEGMDFDDMDDFDVDFDDPTEEEDEEEEDDKEESISNESFKPTSLKSLMVSLESQNNTPKVNIRTLPSWQFFKPLEVMLEKKRLALEEWGLSLEDATDVDVDVSPDDATVEVAVASNNADEESVVYTKEPIIESLTRLGEVNRRYVANTPSFIEKMQKSIPQLDEKILNFEKLFVGNKLKYSNKIVDDIEILKYVSYSGSSDLRESLRRVQKYLDVSNNANKLMLNSAFEKVKDIYLTVGFEDRGEVLEYGKELPGFIKVQVSFPGYDNYVKTNASNFQYFTTEITSTDELYSVNPIAITEDKDVEYYIEKIKETITSLAINVDILSVTNENFRKLMDELKLLRVGVEDDEFEKLSELGLDDKVKEFIMLKLIVESISVNTNLAFNFITSMMSVLEKTVIFKEPTELDTDPEEESSEEEETDEEIEEIDEEVEDIEEDEAEEVDETEEE